MENPAIVEQKSVFDSVDFDETSEFKALVRSIQRADGFSLLFARCNHRPKQKELMKKVFSELPEKRISVFYFENPIENLLDEIRQRLIDEKPAAVFVYGLETSMPKSEIADKTSLVLNLNATRNAFPTVIDCPLIIWLPTYGLKAIMNGAPDFFSVRSGVFFFENDEKLMSQQISEAISLGESEQDALTFEERQTRLEDLKDLLAEYQSLPNKKRDFEAEYELKDRLADLYLKMAHYSKAKKLFQELLDYAEQRNNEEKIANQLRHLGSFYRSEGNYPKAEEFYLKALQIQLNTLGENHPVAASSYNNLGSVYRLEMDYQKAEQYHLKALQIQFSILGENHADTAISYDNLGIVYDLQGAFQKAEEYYLKSLQIRLNIFGKNHPDIARSYNHLGIVYGSNGDYKKAEELYLKSLQIQVNIFGDNHPETAGIYNNLGNVYDSQGNYQKAEENYKKALEIFSKLLPKNHPNIQQVKINLERLLKSQNKVADF